MDIIVVKGLVKKYGDETAVDGLDLTVAEGEIFGFLGPNGAGKTTTVRMISTLTSFSEGEISVGGYDVLKNPKEAKKLMGVIQQHISLDKDLTIRENMMHHAMLQKIPPKERKTKIETLAKHVGLEEYMERTVDSLSGGWKKRAAIVCSLIHEPKVLFMDEPTAGLDIQARRLLWDLIRQLNDNGTTIFLTSHYIEEIEVLCDTVGIIDKGKLIAYGAPSDLCNRIGSTAVEYYGQDHKTHYRYFRSRNEANDFVSTLGDRNTVLIRNTSLEDCFVELTGKKVGED
ncbi:trehalose/maltose import ATP-binding protein MalK [Candidatus Methanoplasma termitum]|uniref:MalK4 protein n=1 Tax=Candidatus Methanoplasma termitum TaxID=1577791 RepID=A0A0A7LC37_9ARCH|nr:ABC transporter ATP-binding protein [Candidatus Methanoplasma termitum]AIZ56594.1 trehalose/maltose import ATP-binding protein MalK [Candidatus Methanoplasma termitum]MCL2333842.1 ABC transporter ATP-binding protein [Candidatus Methanoplasma sp.]